MRNRVTGIIFGLLVLSSPLVAQTPPDTVAPEPVFTHRDVYRAAAFVVAIAAVTPFDKHLAHYFQSPDLQENKAFTTGADFFRFMGQPAPQLIGVGMYGVGKITHSDRLQRLAVHGLEGMIFSNMVTLPIKLIAGRARPYVYQDSDAYNFKLMRGLTGSPKQAFQSFPSGHATTAFAAASAVAAETSHWINESHAWPGWKIVIGATMYGGATLVGVSRMYHDKHWASDVMAGAAIGTFSGIKAVRYSYRHPHNVIERTLISATVVPGEDGSTYLAWSIPFQPR